MHRYVPKGVGNTTRATLIISVATCLGALTGCAEPSIQPLPTEVATTTAAAVEQTPSPPAAVGAFHGTEPQTSAEAVEVGAEVYQQYLRTYADVYTHPEDTSLIDEIAVGGPADSVKEGAATMVRDDWNVVYDDQFTLDPSRSQGLPTTSEDGTVMEFGAVELGGCVDHSARTGTWGPDQAPVTFDPMSKLRVSVIVEFRPESGTFMVTGAALEGGVATPC